MAEKIDVEGNISPKLADAMKKIRKLLHAAEIFNFQCIKRFKNVPRIFLCDYPELIKYFYIEGLYPLTCYHNDRLISDHHLGWEFYPTLSLYNTLEQNALAENMRVFFNITQSIAYLEKSHDFMEIYCFYSSNTNIYIFFWRLLYEIYIFRNF